MKRSTKDKRILRLGIACFLGALIPLYLLICGQAWGQARPTFKVYIVNEKNELIKEIIDPTDKTPSVIIREQKDGKTILKLPPTAIEITPEGEVIKK